MNTSSKVRKIARDIVVAFAHHIKDRIKLNDKDYVQLGIDEDFEVYASLFKVVISKVLDLPIKVDMIYSNTVVTECTDAITSSITLRGYTKLLEKEYIAQSVYDVCLHVLKKVKEEEFADGVAFYH
jgi:hypothetical protein